MEFSTKNTNTEIVTVNFIGTYKARPAGEILVGKDFEKEFSDASAFQQLVLAPEYPDKPYKSVIDINRFYLDLDEFIQSNREIFPIMYRTMPNPLIELPSFFELVQRYGLLHIGTELYKDVNSVSAYIKESRQDSKLLPEIKDKLGPFKYDTFSEWAEFLNYIFCGIENIEAQSTKFSSLWNSILSDLHIDIHSNSIHTKSLKACCMLYCENKDFPNIRYCTTCSNKFTDTSRRGNKVHCSEKCRMNSYNQKRLKEKIKELGMLTGKKYSFAKMNTTNILRRSIKAECLECGHTFEHSEEFFRHQMPDCPKCKKSR